jgi:hypothetical protein
MGPDGSADAKPPAARAILAGPGPDPGSTPHVRLLGASGAVLRDLPGAIGGPDARFGANVAACDLDGDGTDELVVAHGAGLDNDTRVRLLHQDGTPAFPDLGPVYPGAMFGVNVACGDVNGDGKADVITAPGPSPASTAHVKVFEPDGTLVTAFWAYDQSVLYGARVAAGDLDGDGRSEIVTAPGPAPGSGAHVRAFSLDAAKNATEVAGFMAFDSLCGAHVAAGDVDGDGRDEIVAAPGPEVLAPARVRVFRRDGTLVREFAAPNPAPHLLHYGYYHVHDPSFGLHIPDVKGFTNWAHLWEGKYVGEAHAAGMGSILELRVDVHHPEQWESVIQARRASVGADPASLGLEAVLVIDEPHSVWTTAMLSDAVDLTHKVSRAMPP